MDLSLALLVAATVGNGIATGATLDQTFKQLPTRRHIGADAYATYARGADLGNGLIWYPIMGVTAAVLTVAAVVAGLLEAPSAVAAIALVTMGAGTVGFVAATSRAAPTLLTLRRGGTDPEAVLNRFARLNALRAGALVLTLAATIWALVLTVPT
jgi:hypothetical protein